MYKRLKEILRRLFGNQTLYKLEPYLRTAFSLKYRGNEFSCPVCNTDLKSFIILHNGNRICPKCGSSDRDRRLWNYVDKNHLRNHSSILDFSPSRSLYRKFKNIDSIQYLSNDISGDFLADEAYDITNIECNSGSFDLIICYHILEHIIDDSKAMEELHRILKDDGICLIQTPFKDGSIYEDFDILSEEDRLIHFGQEDHVRIYSVLGLKKRLQEAGFNVEVIHFKEPLYNKNGFKSDEILLSCTK